jgi:hypothetical protein
MVKFALLIVILGGMMFFYGVVRYGLTEEMIGRKRWTAANIGAGVLGASIGAGLFVYAVEVARSIAVDWAAAAN